MSELITDALARNKRRRYRTGTPDPLGALPDERRQLLTRWAKRGGNSRWETLASDAGAVQHQLAHQLLDWLLRHGWIVLEEKHRLAEWWPQRVEFRELPALRTALGLKDANAESQRWKAARDELANTLDPVLAPLLDALDALPTARALNRVDLVTALARWRTDSRQGTRRDFALFARTTTKSLSDAEWNWLNNAIDLAECGIERHTPLLLLAAPLALHLSGGTLDLAACAGFAAITPATLAEATSASGTVQRWRLIENRTSFERLARKFEANTGVIWLPGFPPGWWREAVSRLLQLAPAPADIACDPDPAGIEIASLAAETWHAAGLDWQPWMMDRAQLAALPNRQPLTPRDCERLAVLRTHLLPAALEQLLEWMEEHGEKGEQEGFL